MTVAWVGAVPVDISATAGCGVPRSISTVDVCRIAVARCCSLCRYPIHVGLQHGVIRDSVPDGVPLTETLMPQIFRDADYSTHIVRCCGGQPRVSSCERYVFVSLRCCVGTHQREVNHSPGAAFPTAYRLRWGASHVNGHFNLHVSPRVGWASSKKSFR